MQISDIKIADYDYPLPNERIAAYPLSERDQCKLLAWNKKSAPETHTFAELPDLLPSDSMLVYNNTKVIHARLRLQKPSGAGIEIFCLEPVSPADYESNFGSTSTCVWKCMVGNSKRWKSGEIRGKYIRAERLENDGQTSMIRFSWDQGMSFSEVIEREGEIPIPPYLNRESEKSDEQDYQTVYSRIDGSVAAPTAGLHFTPEVLKAIDGKGIPRRELTLHVGAGTFAPVKSENIGGHEMHSEFIAVPRTLIEELKDTSRRIIAVGTTSVRTLESLYQLGCLAYLGKGVSALPQWFSYSDLHPRLDRKEALEALLKSFSGDVFYAQTQLMIAPGYDYKIVQGMVTNFHQPKSTLLLLVSAFLGERDWRQAYDYALANGYRFLSYGDACLFL